MFKQLTFASPVLLLTLLCPYSNGEVVIFQQGVNGYSGTLDVVFRGNPGLVAGVGTPAYQTPFANDPFIEVENDSEDELFPEQGAIRFDSIFAANGGPIPGGDGGLVPANQAVLFAELEFVPDDDTSEDAEISFNRVLGNDLNRNSGSGPWSANDTWNSLGGTNPSSGGNFTGGILNLPKPINVAETGDDEFGDPEAEPAGQTFDADGNPRGILPSELNTVNINDVIAGARITIDVTDSLQAWQAGAPNLGWAINNTDDSSFEFISSDFSINALTDENGDPDLFEQALWQSRLNALGRTEEQVRPVLRVAFGISGDITGIGDPAPDGMVTTEDFDLLRSQLGNTFATRGEPGDLDFDRDVDLDDFVQFKNVWEDLNGAGSFALLVSRQVPEPSSLVLVLGILLGTAGVRSMRSTRVAKS